MAKKNNLSPMLKRVMLYIFTKPATSGYPFVELHVQDNFRGQPAFDTAVCIGCGLCSRDCPAKAIEMVQLNGKKYPQVNLAKCIFCYSCAETCPKKAVTNSAVFELATTDKSSLIMKPEITA